MMCLEVSESNRPWIHDSGRLTATIHLAGEWKRSAGARNAVVNGTRAFAARFLSMDPLETVDDMVRVMRSANWRRGQIGVIRSVCLGAGRLSITPLWRMALTSICVSAGRDPRARRF